MFRWGTARQGEAWCGEVWCGFMEGDNYEGF